MQQRAWTLVVAVVGIGIVAACKDKEVTAPPANITYKATLSSANELPNASGQKPNTAATGTWTGVLNPTTNVMTWTLTFSGLSANSTGGHIHAQAATTANANVVLNFATFAGGNFVTGTTGGTYTGTVNMSSATTTGLTISGDSLRKAMDAGMAYVNVHSTNWTGGEIRGQISKQ